MNALQLLQLEGFATMVMYDCLEALISMKGELKYASMMHGEQFAMTCGATLMLVLCVNSLDMEAVVRYILSVEKFSNEAIVGGGHRL